MENGNYFTPESEDAKPRKSWEELVQNITEADSSLRLEQAEMAAMTELFNERKGQFLEADLDEDACGGWKTFEEKVRAVFPEIPERHFTAIKLAVTMELCGQ